MKTTYTVIIVEDDVGLNYLIRKTLNEEGFRTESVLTGADAIAKVSDNRKALLLLDYDLPDMKGKQVIDNLTAKEINVPFIVITAQGNEEIAVEMMKRGAMDYIVKGTGLIGILPHIIKKVFKELSYKQQLARAEEKLIEEKNRLEEVTDYVHCGLLLLDCDMKVIYANKVSEEWFGPYRNIKNKLCCDIFKLRNKEEECASIEVLRTGETVRREALFTLHNGEEKFFYMIASPVKDDNGAVHQITKVVMDVTERRRAEEFIRIQSDLGLALSGVRDLKESLTLILNAACRLEGMDCGAMYLKDQVSGSLDLICSRGLSESFVGRVSHYDSGSRNALLAMKGEAVYINNEKLDIDESDPGNCEGILSVAVVPVTYRNEVIGCMNIASHTVKDISVTFCNVIETIAHQAGSVIARLVAEEALTESEERYRRITETITDYIYTVKVEDGRPVETTHCDACSIVTGYSAQEFMDDPYLWIRMVVVEDHDHVRQQAAQVLSGKLPKSIEHRIIRKDGKVCWVESTVIPNHDRDGNLISYDGIVCDITERKHSELLLEKRAFYDDLTNLPNRTLFAKHLGFENERTKRHNNYLFAVLFIDLDHFKTVNDSLGHMIGDQLLVSVARRIEACVRPNDTISRFGGDEFAVLLDNINDISDATYIADRIQRELSIPLRLGNQEICTSASIGIALSSSGYESEEEILRDADSAMYHAKARGRARYEIFDSEMHVKAMRIFTAGSGPEISC